MLHAVQRDFGSLFQYWQLPIASKSKKSRGEGRATSTLAWTSCRRLLLKGPLKALLRASLPLRPERPPGPINSFADTRSAPVAERRLSAAAAFNNFSVRSSEHQCNRFLATLHDSLVQNGAERAARHVFYRVIQNGGSRVLFAGETLANISGTVFELSS